MSRDIQLPLVRCYTCKKPIGALSRPYNELLAKGQTPRAALDQLGVDRYCCRTNIMNPPLMPAGAVVDDDIAVMQRDLDLIHREPVKAHPTGAILAAMRQPGAAQVEFAGTTGQTVRVIPGVQGSVKVRRDYSFEEAYQVLKRQQLSDEEILRLFQGQGVNDENARKQKYRIRRENTNIVLEVVPLA